MQQLLQLAHELGLTVVERHGGKIGGYHDGSRTIRLKPGMTERTARSVLAHEIAHAIFEDQPTHHGPVRARQERRANEWAAMHLITPEAYAAAEDRRGVHAASLAYDLNVTVELVEAYQRLMQRLGDVTYVRARMGAGQWHHRVEAVAS